MFEKCFSIFALFDNVKSIPKMFYKWENISENERPSSFRHDLFFNLVPGFSPTRSMGRVGENPGNEVAFVLMQCKKAQHTLRVRF